MLGDIWYQLMFNTVIFDMLDEHMDKLNCNSVVTTQQIPDEGRNVNKNEDKNEDKNENTILNLNEYMTVEEGYFGEFIVTNHDKKMNKFVLWFVATSALLYVSTYFFFYTGIA
jgi:hypothetical protein